MDACATLVHYGCDHHFGHECIHVIIVAIWLSAEHFRGPGCFRGSRKTDSELLPAGILFRSLLVGTVIGVLWPEVNLHEYIHLLFRLHLPLCLYSEYRWSACWSVSMRDFCRRCAFECTRDFCRSLGSCGKTKLYDTFHLRATSMFPKFINALPSLMSD